MKERRMVVELGKVGGRIIIDKPGKVNNAEGQQNIMKMMGGAAPKTYKKGVKK